MSRQCCVKSCNAIWSPITNLSFFSLPLQNEELKKKWLDAAPGYKSFTKNSKICSDHFLPEDYKVIRGRRFLNKNAVPSVFKLKYLNASQNAPDVSSLTEPGCSSSKSSQIMNISKIEDKCDIGIRTASDSSEGEEDKRPWKKFCNASVQTEPRLVGPTDEVKKLRHEIKILKNRLRRKESRITNIKDIVEQLKDRGKCTKNLEEELLKKFSDFDLELFKNEENNNTAKNMKRYTEKMKEFAATLYFYSPRAYEFVRTKINLPHASSLRRWVADFTIEPGLVPIVFQFLKRESQNKPYLQDVGLIFECMAIRKQLLLDTKFDKCRGLVDYGPIATELKLDYNSQEAATEPLVFQIVSYRDKFKCAIAHFFIAKLPADHLSKLLKAAIEKLFDVGVTVRSITCDGCALNESTIKLLGRNLDPNDLVTHFKHPKNNSNIHVILDPSHTMKLCRNVFVEKTVVSPQGDISFTYLKDLHSLQKAEGMKLANRLTQNHIFYRRKKMKVSLATQTISSGVADAIDFVRSAGLTEFQGSEATSEFIRIFDRLFDMQNTRNSFGLGFKSPLSLSNAKVWEEAFDQSEDYIRSLKLDGRSILTH